MRQFETNKDAEHMCSSDFWYDLFDGGYIDPSDMLDNVEEAAEVMLARNTLSAFRHSVELAGLVQEM